MRPITLILFLSFAAAACSSSDPDPAQDCGPNGECPSGFTCDTRSNKCVASGGTADARTIDAKSTDGGADAKTSDAGGGTDAKTSDAGSGGDLDTTITSGPTGSIKVTTAAFNFVSVPAGLTFECRLDNETFATCTSGKSYTNLTEAKHTFEVRAKDGSGAVDPTPAVATFNVDLTAPQAMITSGPSDGGTSGANGTFTYTTTPADPTATFECTFDSQTFLPCLKTGFPFGPLVNGTVHTFQVRAVDTAGNAGTPDKSTFTVDLSGPLVTITSPANGGAVGTTFPLTFTFVAETGATFTCKLDQEPTVAGCESGHLFTATPGPHTVTVQGTDASGNPGDPASSTFTVAPATTVTIVFPTDGATTGPDGQVTYLIGDSTELDCTLDTRSVVCPLGGAYTYLGLMGGSHTFTIRGRKPPGELGPADSVTWTVDDLGPFVHIDQPGDDLAGGPGFTCPNGSITYDCDQGQSQDGDCPPVEFDCSLDGASFEECNSGIFEFMNLEDGEHTLDIFAIDTYDNIGDSERVTWSVDGLGPELTIVAPVSAAGPTSGPGGEIVLDIPEEGAFVAACTVDLGRGALEQDCSSLSYGGLGDGDNPHTITVTVSDPCGNLTTHAVSFIVDSTAPVVATLTATPGTGDGVIAFGGTLTDASDVDHIFVALDGAAAVDRGSGKTLSYSPTELSAGVHTIIVHGIDEWGNSGATATIAAPPAQRATRSATETYGPNLGRLILVGYDFLNTPSSELTNLLGHAAGLAAWKQIPLAFTRHVKVASWNGGGLNSTERSNALAAITAGIGSTWSAAADYREFTGTSAAALAAGLVGRDVLLFLDENGAIANLETQGGAWHDTLKAFLIAGGTVVMIDGRGTGGVPSDTAAIYRGLPANAPRGEQPLLLAYPQALAAEDPVLADNIPADHPLNVADAYTQVANSVYFNGRHGQLDTPDLQQPLEIYLTGGDCGSECFDEGAAVIDKIFPVYLLGANVSFSPSGQAHCPTGTVSLGVTAPADGQLPAGASYSCQLDGANVACNQASVLNYTTGQNSFGHELLFRVIDVFGNPGRQLLTEWSVDKFGPQLFADFRGSCGVNTPCQYPNEYTCGNGQNGCTNSICCQDKPKAPGGVVHFVVDTNEAPGATFTCSWDGATPVACTCTSYGDCSVAIPAALKCNNTHTLAIVGKDECGNTANMLRGPYSFFISCPIP